MKKRNTNNIARIFIVISFSSLFLVSCSQKTPKLRKPITDHELDIVYGSDDAELTIYMFTDYNCIHCRRFLAEVLPKIEEDYIKTEKVKFVLKLINFSSNEKIINAYKTAICLNKYGEFTDLNELFILQPKTMHTSEFEDLIDDYIIRNSYFAECLFSIETDAYLLDIKKDYIVNQFTGTPTFVINNRFYKGFQAYEKFEEIIRKELRKN